MGVAADMRKLLREFIQLLPSHSPHTTVCVAAPLSSASWKDKQLLTDLSDSRWHRARALKACACLANLILSEPGSGILQTLLC